MSDHPERSGPTPPAPQLPAAPGAAPAACAPGNPLQLTDPRMMRALAHPARIAIWQFLGLEGPATATECAEVAGLSPSACSYHLRTLARYGFVEEDLASAADGRQRPWRATVIAYQARWREAVGTSYDVLHATPEELNTLQQRLTGLLGEYRRLSREQRPHGARRVQVRVDLIPWFEPDA